MKLPYDKQDPAGRDMPAGGEADPDWHVGYR